MESIQDFRGLLDSQEFDFRFQCGISKPAVSVTLEERQRIVDAFCLHYCIFSTVAELEQLKQGLAVQKFITLMEKYPGTVRTAFQPAKQVVTSSLIEQIYCNHTNLAPRGSDKWYKQQGILNAWSCYLRNIEGRANYVRICSYVLHLLFVCHIDQVDAVPSLQDVFQFLTGCSCVPPSGFDVEGSFTFDEVEAGLPVVSTCGLTIAFPNNFPINKFKEKMDLAILSSKDFGSW